MKTFIAPLALILAVVATFAEAHPRRHGHSHNHNHYAPTPVAEPVTLTRQARVVSVEPNYRYSHTTGRSRQVCEVHEVPVYSNQRVYNGNSYVSHDPGSALAGALIGGILGHAVADNEKKGAVVGAIGGALLGAHASQNAGYSNERYISGYRNKEVCRTVQDRGHRTRVQDGYTVQYRFRGQIYTTEMDQNPGQYLTVQVTR